jgi:sugar O-acyltransferase (sialic acid O-acetyltransferase NeuD family)
MKKVVLIGAGGHARVLLDILLDRGEVEVLGLLDHDSTRWGQNMLGCPILGGDGELGIYGATNFVVAVGSLGDTGLRRRLWQRGMDAGLEPLAVIAPSATVSQWAQIGAGAQIMPGAIVNAGAQLGEGVILNSGALVEHDCVIGDFCHVASGATLAGAVVLESDVHIGAGAVVRQGIRIGIGALVGAAAGVVKDVPAGAKVAGVPAKPL